MIRTAVSILIQSLGLAASSSTPAWAADSGSCIKYVYADPTKAQNDQLPIMGCRDIQANTAVNCSRLGTLSLKKLQAAEEKAKENMWAYGKGVLAGMACTFSLDVAPFLLPRSARAAVTVTKFATTHIDETKAAEAALRNDQNGTRELGDLASKEREEEFKSLVGKMCNWTKKVINEKTPNKDISAHDSYNMGVDAVLQLFAVNSAHAVALKGDAMYIWSLPPKDRKAAYEKMQAKAQQIGAEQAQVMKKAADVAAKTYQFLTDNSLRTIPFGTDPNGVSNDLKCIAPADVTKLRGTLCNVAKTLAEFEGFFPGDLYQNGGKQQTAEALNRKLHESAVAENCSQDSDGKMAPLLTKVGEGK